VVRRDRQKPNEFTNKTVRRPPRLRDAQGADSIDIGRWLDTYDLPSFQTVVAIGLIPSQLHELVGVIECYMAFRFLQCQH
jgi:hypothetical protein